MKNEIDFAAINRAALDRLPSLLAYWLPNGRLDGHEYKVGNLRGDSGDSLCINVNSCLWSDFAGNETGNDPISLLAAVRGVKMSAAARELAEHLRIDLPQPQRAEGGYRQTKPKEWQPVIPCPVTPPTELRVRVGENWQPVPVVRAWLYFDSEARPIGYACRIEFADGSKDVIPVMWDGHKWRQSAFPKPRPLYDLVTLSASPGKQVVIVEGEKKADAWNAVLSDIAIAVAWAGGCKAVKHSDWSVLAGRKCVLWPDADDKFDDRTGLRLPAAKQPGIKAMQAIAEILEPIAAGIRIVDLPPPGELPDGWDVADALADGWGRDRVLTFMRERLRKPDRAPSDHQPQELPSHLDDVPMHDMPPDDYTPSELPEIGDDAPFQCLGYNHGQYYYLARGSQQVAELSGSGHNKANLLMLAPLRYWERTYPDRKGADWDMAANALLRFSERVGVYDPARIRGLGCWVDDGRTVLHLGDRLLVDGVEHNSLNIGGRYIYEASKSMPGPGEIHATPEDRRLIIDLAKSFRWEIPGSAMLLAGWVVLAPICGALSWRPHIWLAGGTGSGKTTVQKHFIWPLLAGTAYYFQGSSTEPGIRQTLMCDALPSVVDEMEQNTQPEHNRVQAILAMARQASSDSEAKTAKGGAQGNPLAFHIRSMFAFAAIQNGIHMQADNTRIVVLNLRSAGSTSGDPREAQEWQQLQSMLAGITPEMGRRLFKRTVGMVATIRASIEVFKRAVAVHFGNQRLGDTYGTLLAGAWSLKYDSVATEEQAAKFIGSCDWNVYTESARENESEAALSSIMQIAVRVDGERMAETLTIGELVEFAAGSRDTPNISKTVAARHLARFGVKIVGDQLVVANKSDALAKALSDKPWGVDWRGYLRRIDGAAGTKNPVRFATGILERATSIPIERVLAG